MIQYDMHIPKTDIRVSLIRVGFFLLFYIFNILLIAEYTVFLHGSNKQATFQPRTIGHGIGQLNFYLLKLSWYFSLKKADNNSSKTQKSQAVIQAIAVFCQVQKKTRLDERIKP